MTKARQVGLFESTTMAQNNRTTLENFSSMRRPSMIPSAAHKLALSLAIVWLVNTPTNADAGTFVRFITTRGTMVMLLFDDVMPRSVDNFLSYVNSDRYNNTIVHRNAQPGPFVIQGGNFTFTDQDGLGTIPLDPAIADEQGGSALGPLNTRGTIAFAKAGANSATSQWFINLNNNSALNFPQNGGFAAFGAVILNGMNVADAIHDIPTYNGGTSQTPLDQGMLAPQSTPPNQQQRTGDELPLQNYSGPNLVTNSTATEANFIYILDASVINPRSGDFNLNGFVDDQDLAILTSNYGLASGALWDNGDLDMDGDVDGQDLLGWQRGFRPPPAVSGVPEPASFALAAGGFAALGFARRRKHGNG